MKNIAVFCGSSMGNKKIFKEEASKLGSKLAEKEIGLVYGGASIGLMGVLAENVVENGGRVTGVIPKFLYEKEKEHKTINDLIFVENLKDGKIKMNELSDGMIVLPGGYGTLDELFEMATLSQLGLLKKPIGLLNIDGYFHHLIQMIDTMIENGFLDNKYKKVLIIEEDSEKLINKMKKFDGEIEW